MFSIHLVALEQTHLRHFQPASTGSKIFEICTNLHFNVFIKCFMVAFANNEEPKGKARTCSVALGSAH